MTDLSTWLRTQLDEDERIAREARQRGEWWFASRNPSVNLHALTAHAQRWEPVRALAEVDAKRRILSLHRCDDADGTDPICNVCLYTPPCETVKTLALPYADRPGYREEWRP
ncbi:DUF6221 family protein [Micromonospora sp. NPDC005299]|uniref:DUF6221 family protein n=1 Tax=Micromonospora sp. NPDC005299 TaxID=3364231 RepID=UPI0036BC5A95